MLKRENFLVYLSLSLFLFATFSILADALKSGPVRKQPQIGENQEVYGVSKELVSGEKRTTRVLLLGDVMLGRSVMGVSLKKDNPSYPFEKVKDELKGADIVFANLENPVVKDCPPHDEGFIFCTDPKMLEGLRDAGVDVVTLANNHSGNYGEEGVKETLKYLDEYRIDATGVGELATVEVNGTTFGFLGFEFVSKAAKGADFVKVKEAKRKTDVLIIGVHWGVEYTSDPVALQREWAKRFVEAGADVVVGHHPHWVQSSEFIQGKPVYYSLGNFVFDQMWSEETKKGIVVELDFENGKLLDTRRRDIYMSSFAQPEFVE